MADTNYYVMEFLGEPLSIQPFLGQKYKVHENFKTFQPLLYNQERGNLHQSCLLESMAWALLRCSAGVWMNTGLPRTSMPSRNSFRTRRVVTGHLLALGLEKHCWAFDLGTPRPPLSLVG